MVTDVLVNFVQRWLKQAAPEQKNELLPLPEVLSFFQSHLSAHMLSCPGCCKPEGSKMLQAML